MQVQSLLIISTLFTITLFTLRIIPGSSVYAVDTTLTDIASQDYLLPIGPDYQITQDIQTDMMTLDDVNSSQTDTFFRTKFGPHRMDSRIVPDLIRLGIAADTRADKA